ncbi:MAG: glycosyltransferase family 9 protein [Chlamydiae bacterium]|nr:glycosyltransferase family 9 protein [Chlamydiota bacterium]
MIFSHNGSFLIVKMSALGDVLQALDCAQYLKNKYPFCHITWAIETKCASLAAACPYIDEVISLDIKGLKRKPWQFIKASLRFLQVLNKRYYDVIWDLQGNCKSAIVTYFTKGACKVGFGKNSVAEWPGTWVVDKMYEVEPGWPIAEQYLFLLRAYFQDEKPFVATAHHLKVSEKILLPKTACPHRFMVCPGSFWENKRLSEDTLFNFLSLLKKHYKPFMVLIWGTEQERVVVERLSKKLKDDVLILGQLKFPCWQQLMTQMDCVITMDSCALHLAALAGVATFSVFGASSSQVYRPQGIHHKGYQGRCPYGEIFTKRCPKLRTCRTGACIKDIQAEALMEAFSTLKSP